MKTSTFIMGRNWTPPASKAVLVGQVLMRVLLGVVLGTLWAALGYFVVTGGGNPFGAL